jgi:lipopolysaccharide/colanic/teichoic acid biosynthesis glycosyltransferase
VTLTRTPSKLAREGSGLDSGTSLGSRADIAPRSNHAADSFGHRTGARAQSRTHACLEPRERKRYAGERCETGDCVSNGEPRRDPCDELALLAEGSAPPARALAIKHALDPVLASLALALGWPVLVIIGLAVWASMGRPILFIQTRGGLHGRPFRMLKFRSMRVGAEAERDELEVSNEMSGPVFKMREDPRVTPFGRFLRTSSLDELPQLLNVLTGSMSLVGPRPLPVQEHAQLRGWQRRRASVKPGLTCLWQIGGRSDVDFSDWMRLDLKYIDEWSLWLDLVILLKTIPFVLLGRGAR